VRCSWYVPFIVKKRVAVKFLKFNVQTYVPTSPAATTFRHADGKLWFDWSVTTRTLHLVRYSNILDQFWDCDDYLEDQRAPFLTNNAVAAALSSR
jgi:hypothetical protein